ncbi:MAG: sulfotransferase [Frankiaceae bacterium]|nr:sulfotransferase [Frankiaceae bacterium]
MREGADGRGPDFIGIGVQKAGTSWWYRLLCEHPEIGADAVVKERHFFDRFCAADFTERHAEEYRALFPAALDARLGEWTPRYLYDPWVPPLLFRAAPDAKLLILLRDPVARFESALTHNLRSAGFGDVALAATDAFHRGRYGEQLQRLMYWFDSTRVLILQYEQCVSDPAGELARTFAFLGVDPTYIPDVLTEPVRATIGGKIHVSESMRAVLQETYHADRDLVASLAPELDLGLWS